LAFLFALFGKTPSPSLWDTSPKGRGKSQIQRILSGVQPFCESPALFRHIAA